MKCVLVAAVSVVFSTSAWSQACKTSSELEASKAPTPVETVTAFSAAISTDNGKAAIRRWFTPQTVWINEGVSATTGIEEAIAFLDRPSRSPAIASVHFDMLAIAAQGHQVLTERLDRFVGADGRPIAAVKVMGIFEVDGECIVAWRDYFDVNFAKKVSKDQR